MAKNEQPLQMDPRSLAISKSNRQFNALQVHKVILKSIARDGHDPTRPHVGICVEVTDPAQLKDLVEYNKELSDNSDLMPPSASKPGAVRVSGLHALQRGLALGESKRPKPRGRLGCHEKDRRVLQ